MFNRFARRTAPLLAAACALALMPAPVAARAARPDPIAAAIAQPARDAKQRALDESRQPAAVLAFAGIKPGQVVVDYFGGSGYFTELIAPLVGSKGAVYVLNPPSFHDPKEWTVLPARHPNVRLLVTPVPAMQMAPGSVDLLFNHLNYHDLYWESDRFKYPRIDVPPVLLDWFRMVKPGGHVLIIDHIGPAGDPRVMADKLHRIDPARIKADMAAAGFVLEAESPVLLRSDDQIELGVFDKAVRGKTSRAVLKFRRP